MSVAFMTEAEADEIIEKNIDEIFSKLTCSTQCTSSAASTGLTGQCDSLVCDEFGSCCGCCG